MATKTQTTKDETAGDLVIAREDDAVAYVVPVKGVVSTLTSPTMKFYKEGSTNDLSSTYWGGSMSVSGFSIITKATQNLKAGDYILSINATADGQSQNVLTVKFKIKRRSEL